MIYRVYGAVAGTKYIGTVEAESQEEAEEKAEDLASQHTPRLCHQCSGECEDPDFSELIVDADDE